MKELKITIGTDGAMEVEAFGFKGKACERSIAALMEAIGAEERKVTKVKPEYNQVETTQEMRIKA